LGKKNYTFEQIKDTPDGDIPVLLDQLGYEKSDILVRSSIRTMFNQRRQTTTPPPEFQYPNIFEQRQNKFEFDHHQIAVGDVVKEAVSYINRISLITIGPLLS